MFAALLPVVVENSADLRLNDRDLPLISATRAFTRFALWPATNTVAPSTALTPDLRSPARGSINLIGYDKVAVTPVSSSAQPTDSASSGTQKRT